jgi:site-specific DNA recombinase
MWDTSDETPAMQAEIILVSTLTQRLLEVSFIIDGDSEATGSNASSAGKIKKLHRSVQMLRRAGCIRGSTSSQAIEGLSHNDQMAQIEAFYSRVDMAFLSHLVDSGLTGSNEDRPEFKHIVADVLTKPCTFDRIIAHSASRFFRDAAIMALTIRRLCKADVGVIFITQPTTRDSNGNIFRQMLGIIDEHASREASKHVKRSMLENSRQVFWNGATPPFGYKSNMAEIRGEKEKKKLEIDPVESRIFGKMFDLAGVGDRVSGPPSVNAVVNWLHSHGYSTRERCAWLIQTVNSILTRTIYGGVHWFNTTNPKMQKPRPVAEHISVEVPVIIETERWKKVQSILRSKSPEISNPKIITGPILLTGLVRSESCGFAMTLRTEKSGLYRYYTCVGTQSCGPAVCIAILIPIGKFDNAITICVTKKLLRPDRLQKLFKEVLSREQQNASGSKLELVWGGRELLYAKQRIYQLVSSVERGFFDVDDPDLRIRFDTAKLDRNIATEAKLRIDGRIKRATDVLPAKLGAFADFIREALQSGNVPFRKSYLRAVIEWMDVTKNGARIRVSRAALRS